jgi:hypothetical protein
MKKGANKRRKKTIEDDVHWTCKERLDSVLLPKGKIMTLIKNFDQHLGQKQPTLSLEVEVETSGIVQQYMKQLGLEFRPGSKEWSDLEAYLSRFLNHIKQHVLLYPRVCCLHCIGKMSQCTPRGTGTRVCGGRTGVV